MKYDSIALTGITGHLGFVLAKQLVDRGYRIRAIVRDKEQALGRPWLAGLPVEIVQGDIRDQKAMERLLEGVEGLFHVAAAFNVTARNAETNVVKHNLDGTHATISAAIRNKLKRVVYTSSVAAVGTSQNAQETRDESFWNNRSPEPYARSKALSEKLAWDLAGDSGLNLVTALPGAILGPDFHRLNPTLQLIQSAMAGKLPLAPPIDFSFADVRDVAQAHVQLFEDETASGRYLLSGETLRIVEVMREMKQLRADLKITSKEMPEWFAAIFPYFDAALSVVTGTRQMTSGFVREYVGRCHVLSCSRAKNKIGWNPRPLRETLRDTMDWFDRTDRRP
jgi:dihydroflavonol-4-reductase